MKEPGLAHRRQRYLTLTAPLARRGQGAGVCDSWGAMGHSCCRLLSVQLSPRPVKPVGLNRCSAADLYEMGNESR